jgi:hypothetical protein
MLSYNVNENNLLGASVGDEAVVEDPEHRIARIAISDAL